MELEAFDNLVFKNKEEFRVFRDILSTLNHVKPQLIKRDKFNKLNGDYIKEKGEDKYGKYYTLFLPKDLRKGELFGIIEKLNSVFNLKSESKNNQLITQTKILFSIILREKGEKRVKKICKKYNINDELILKIQNTALDYNEARSFLIDINQKGATGKVSNLTNKEVSSGIETLIKNLKNEFELIFLRKGVRMLGNYMETITRDEQIKLDEDSDEDEIILHREASELDKNVMSLRDKIGIDSIKSMLEKAREKGDEKMINEIEINATNIIISCLYDYPYQMTENNYGYQPSEIIKSKELYCVGYCFLGHTFLKELGIKHKGIIAHPSHSVIEIEIGGNKYYFDASYFSEIHEFEYGKRIKRSNKKGKYRELIFKDPNIRNGEYEDGQKAYGFSVEIEIFLLANIYINKGVEYPLDYTKLSCLVNKKVLELIPDNFEAYFNIGTKLNAVDETEGALEYLNKAQEINPQDEEIYLLKSDIYKKIGNYLEQLRMLNTAQSICKNDTSIYLAKAKTYKSINQKRLSLIYQFIGQYLNLDSEENAKIHFEEKEYITELLEEENYKGLIKYLRKIEEKELKN